MRKRKLLSKLYYAIILLVLGMIFINFLKVPNPTQKVDRKFEMKDWHDYFVMEQDRKRSGLGEQGNAAFITDKYLKAKEEKISLIFGYNALLSDMISVNRSIRDIRNKRCKKIKYLKSLPNVSIVIPFYDEHLSVLKRTIHSIINRTPAKLLREIILVDDGSDQEDILVKLKKYVSENFLIVHIVRLEKRVGLIGARLTGARLASAEVIVFLDSHIETNYNWLPPLLEPIAFDKRTVVCPFIDVIDDQTFNYSAQDEGGRGAFNWLFDYKRLPLLPEYRIDRTKLFASPVMAGGLFAISAEFFWELGGYDEGLKIWGGEQYELSFKIWMCGGTLLDAPCSRIGHIYRGKRNTNTNEPKNDYLRRNYKRVAEVWMDEYKKYLYDRDSEFLTIDAGDISKQKALRNKLNCKTFKWYMETVAFDVIKLYPLIEPPDYANGAIQSIANPSLCIDTLNEEDDSKIGLYECAKNLNDPQSNQNWALSSFRDIRLRTQFSCLTVESEEPNAPVFLRSCEQEGGNQFWNYDMETQWIVFERDGDRCLEALPETQSVTVNDCSVDEENMKWKFAFVNITAMKTFFDDIPEYF